MVFAAGPRSPADLEHWPSRKHWTHAFCFTLLNDGSLDDPEQQDENEAQVSMERERRERRTDICSKAAPDTIRNKLCDKPAHFPCCIESGTDPSWLARKLSSFEKSRLEKIKFGIIHSFTKILVSRSLLDPSPETTHCVS